MNVETTFTGLRPNVLYNVSVAVNMTYGLGQPVSAAVTTTSLFVCLSARL